MHDSNNMHSVSASFNLSAYGNSNKFHFNHEKREEGIHENEIGNPLVPFIHFVLLYENENRRQFKHLIIQTLHNCNEYNLFFFDRMRT